MTPLQRFSARSPWPQYLMMLTITGLIVAGWRLTDANLEANARRALAISFPVVFQLLGEIRFADACRQYLRHSPLAAGDWAEWGDSFPEWLELPVLSEQLPYLPDMARLDWLSHQIGRAEDAPPDFESLQMLAAANAGAGHLVINPTLTLLTSAYSGLLNLAGS